VTRRSLAWIVACVLGIVALAGALWGVFGVGRVVLSEAELQARANRQLPREVHGVTIERVTVTLGQNQVALRIAIHGNALGQPYAAVAFARGVPRYDTEASALFFDAEAVKVESLVVRSTTLIGRDDNPSSRAGALSQAIRDRFPRLEATAQSAIEKGAQAFLAARPVYRVKDDVKGIVIKAALAGVAIEQDALVIDFSVWRLTVTVIAWLLVLLLVVAAVIQLVRHPLWGLGQIAESISFD